VDGQVLLLTGVSIGENVVTTGTSALKALAISK
jgi:cobalt-zinc-cadmium efflux system membrane fusion protein